MININEDRFINTMKYQAEVGGTGNDGELSRVAGSDAYKDICDWLVDQLTEEGLDVRIDAIGNIFGRREGTDPDAAPVLVGSHLDTQPQGGIFDGPLGVMAALELVRTLNEENIETEHPIEIVNWFNEESGRFTPNPTGSKVWTGVLELEDAYSITDSDGTTVKEELERIGYKGTSPSSPQEVYDSCLELHIEQGPFLEMNEKDVGIVTGTACRNWGTVTFVGQTDHSGGTQLYHRSDALVGAADIVLKVRRIANKVGRRTVGTVGQLDVSPNTLTGVPGEVTFTWGFRDPDQKTVEAAVDHLRREVRCAAEREGLDWAFDIASSMDPYTFDDDIQSVIETAATELGYDSMQVVSGGGHDAQIVGKRVCDAGMVFAVNDSGRSHTCEEYTSWDNCIKGTTTLANAVVLRAGTV